MPYLYTLAEEAARTGLPLMRPLWLEYPDAETTSQSDADAYYTNDRVFFLGDDLLVVPKLDETLDPIEVVVPPGTWYDYWTGERLSGTRKRKLTPALGELPVLVRGGAILPHQAVVQSTSETPKGPLELPRLPRADCHGSLYMDDGNTFNYEKGEFLRLGLSCQEGAGTIRVTTAPAEGSYAPWFSSIAFVVHGVTSAPKEVTVAGAGGASKPVRDYTYDAGKKTVSVTAPYEKGGEVVAVAF